ncbi:MAG: adenylosuccinate lyase, partial [Calditrichaeota bacterium]|nr:adenylosuccinate lyase [Calditrichota bacterium]
MITSISPLDGRYESKVKSLQRYFSEYALIRYRLRIEIEWLIHLANQLPDLTAFSEDDQSQLRSIYQNFTAEQAEEVKEIESVTNHDVKAVEYYLRKQIETNPAFAVYSEFIHFACTSEDINNLAYALMLKDAFNDDIFFKMDILIDRLLKIANDYKSLAMISRTHGQTASPTTLGKEFINVAYRLQRKVNRLREQEALGKINGAVGNFNAHISAYPDLDWVEISRLFVADVLSLKFNLLTTQIEPHDFIAEVCHTTKEFNTILIDF